MISQTRDITPQSFPNSLTIFISAFIQTFLSRYTSDLIVLNLKYEFDVGLTYDKILFKKMMDGGTLYLDGE